MKAIPTFGLLLYPVFISSVLAQPPLVFPPQNYKLPVPVQQVPIRPMPLQPVPMNRMPYTPQPMHPAPYPKMPLYYTYPQQAYPSQRMPAQRIPQAMPHNLPPQQQLSTKKPFKEYSGYLGLITDIVPSSVIAQLPDDITQGILFKGFSENSPASNSDLKPFDVVFAYNETKLNHPSQLIKLIRNDKPGRVAKLKVIRKGKVLEIPVTIGSQKTPNPKDINGLEIKQFGEDKFRAIIHFLGPNGNKQLRSFQGTREDIFDEVREASGLPQAEKQQLLYAMRPKNNNSGFGSFMPFGNNGSKDWKFMDPSKYFKW